jgi:hypothetical protein
MTKKPFPFTDLQLAVINDLKTTTEPQTTGRLHDEDGFCCLGRMCEVLGIPSKWDITAFIYGSGSDLRSGSLPNAGVIALNLYDRGGSINWKKVSPKWAKLGGPQYPALYELNDSAHWSFKQIGEFIEENPEAVFTNGE